MTRFLGSLGTLSAECLRIHPTSQRPFFSSLLVQSADYIYTLGN
jgi:hypothetical protein